MMTVITTAALLVCCAVGSAQAQGRYTLELRGGAAFPDQTNLDGAEPNTGAGLGFTASVRALPQLHVYAGWDWHRFSFDQPLDADLEDTGYAFGVRFQRPFARSVNYWLRAGGIYNHLELESDAGTTIDSGHELGWEAGGGVGYAISPGLELTPGIRYRAFSADMAIKSSGPTTVDHSYLALELGIAWTFGGAPAAVAARIR